MANTASVLPPRVGSATTATSVFGADALGHKVLPNDERLQTERVPGEDDRADEQELLNEAREFLDEVETADADNRSRSAEMLRFCYRRGSQWPDKVRREREGQNRPCLEINQMPAFINQVCNDERQNRPSIKVRGTSSDATEETAEILQDLIRHIEYDSLSDQVYDNAYRYAVAANVGYWRITTEYEKEASFYQKIKICPVRDTLSVYYDTNCIEPDGSDAEKCLITEEVSKAEFRRRYPKAQEVDWMTTDPILTAWIKPDAIRIADYLHKVYWKDTLYLLPTGEVSWASEGGMRDKHDAAEAALRAVDLTMPFKPTGYVQCRVVERCRVAWEVINGVQILEEHDWAGPYIPVIPCWGDVTFVEGETIRQSLVERAQDMQQMYNFWVTTASEGAALQPKTPFIVGEGQIDGREREWGEANNKPFPYLTYKRYSEDGKDLGVPTRSSPDVDVSGMLNQAQVCQSSMRSAIGIQDPLQMMQVEDQSGRAILAKERVGNTATYHFIDNLSRAIRYTGRQLLSLIPCIYDTERTLQLLREDGTQYQAAVNAKAVPDEKCPSGKKNDLSVGDYDVVVDTGPSYSTKRVEFVNAAMELAQANPQLWQVAGDLLVSNMDWPNAESIAERLRAVMPPQILALEAAKDKDPKVVALGQQLQQVQQQGQQQMQAMGQQMQQLQTENMTLKANVAGARIETQSAKLQLVQKNAEIVQKARETQSDFAEQQMESRDVALQQQTDRMELTHKMKMDEKEFALQVVDRVLAAVALQQKQMQPVMPEVLADKQQLSDSVGQ